MKLKILVLPDGTYPTSHTVLEEVYANILPNKGHKITWVMQSGEKLKKNKIVHWKGTKVSVTMASPRTSRFGSLINHILRCIGKILIIQKIVKGEKFDLVQVREGIIEGIIAIYLKKRCGIPFSFQYTFPFPEAGIYSSKRGFARYPLIYYVRGKISKPIFMWVMRKADLVLPVSKQMKQDLIKGGIPGEKMMVFPMGADTSISPNMPGAHIRKKFKLSTFPTIIYVGTMVKNRELDFLLRVIVKVKKKIPNIKLLMVGDGNDRLQLGELSKSLGIENNVIFAGQILHSLVPEFIAAANIGVSPIPSVPIFKVGSATKTIEYMALGKPVIGTDIADQKEVINNSGGGICVRYDEEEFARAIIELLSNPQKAKEMGVKGREWVVRNRSYDILVNNLEQRYFDLVQSNHLKNHGTKNQKRKVF
jgi:glycosyltransferase involved in cell wall biosynthesis